MEREEVLETDLQRICWKDENFVELYGLSLENVMEYFAKSPFYDPTSIYGLLRMQARFNHLEYTSISKSNMTGIDYEPTITSESPLTFVIYKYHRKADSHDVENLGAYYIIDASIYQAPDFHTLINNRVLGSLYYAQKALNFAQEEFSSHPEMGHGWNTMESIIAREESENNRDDDLEEDTELNEILEQPATRALKLQNTSVVQSGYDRIILNTTTAMINNASGKYQMPDQK